MGACPSFMVSLAGEYLVSYSSGIADLFKVRCKNGVQEQLQQL